MGWISHVGYKGKSQSETSRLSPGQLHGRDGGSVLPKRRNNSVLVSAASPKVLSHIEFVRERVTLLRHVTGVANDVLSSAEKNVQQTLASTKWCLNGTITGKVVTSTGGHVCLVFYKCNLINFLPKYVPFLTFYNRFYLLIYHTWIMYFFNESTFLKKPHVLLLYQSPAFHGW